MANVTLTWPANPATDNIVAYDIYGANGTSVAFGSTTLLASVSSLTWTNVGLPNNQTRTYYRIARNAVGSSASPDGPINITTGAPSIYVQNAGGTPSIQEGTHASRPAAGNAGNIYIETDTKTVWRDNGASWDQLSSGGGGGYTPGTVPTVVQVAYAVNGGNSVTFSGAPANGNLLVAMSFNPTSSTVGSGWTSKALVATGTDFGQIMTKTAGAGESTTQTPCSGVSTTGAIIVWELHAASTPTFITGQTQAEQSGTSNVAVLLPNTINCIGLAAVAAVTNSIASSLNVGTQDVLDNSNTRRVVAGHTDLSQTPMAGISTTFASTTGTKGATCLVSS